MSGKGDTRRPGNYNKWLKGYDRAFSNDKTRQRKKTTEVSRSSLDRDKGGWVFEYDFE